MAKNKSFDYEKIQREFLDGPRLNSLMPYFEKIANGSYQSPIAAVEPLAEFLENEKNKEFCQAFLANIGTFFKHAVASIPFVLEEHCRISVAIIEMAKLENQKSEAKQPFTYHEISAGDGTIGRTIGELSKGLIQTLTDTPNSSNLESFNGLCTHNNSTIYIGPFANITPESIPETKELTRFKDGFDVILEPMAFQMYGQNRKEQIAFVRRNLKEDGLFILMEKLAQSDPQEYKKREILKDSSFKNKYFSQSQIIQKESDILHEMRKGQVTFDELTDAIKVNFQHAWMIWNSTNFYGFVASDDIQQLEKFTSLLGSPHVPEEYVFEPDLVMKRIF